MYGTIDLYRIGLISTVLIYTYPSQIYYIHTVRTLYVESYMERYKATF